MHDYDLIRRDNEYQQEIRRRKMTDGAKIGLLVAQNIQQYQTNRILARVHNEACRTNEFLGYIAGTLDEIAAMHATHFEQVQRERRLKELLFQFEKLFNEMESHGDPVATAFGVKRLFEILERPGNGFTTADLPDLDDKRHFDSLLTRGRNALTSLPAEQFKELEDFEQLLGVYYQRQAEGFDPARVFPMKKHVKLPKQYRNEPAWEEQPPTSNALASADRADALAFTKCGCGVVVLGFGMLILLALLSELSGISHSSTPPPPGVLPVGLLSLLAGGALLVNYFLGKSKRAKQREDAVKEQQQVERQFHEQQVRQRQECEARKRIEQAKVADANRQIDAEYAAIEEKRQKAVRLFEVTSQEMRSLLNGFLDRHPMVGRFVARV